MDFLNEIYKVRKITGDDIILALQIDFNATISLLEEDVFNIDYDSFSNDNNKMFLSILMDHGYVNEKGKLFLKSPIAYYLCIKKYFYPGNNFDVEFNKIPEFIASDMFNNTVHFLLKNLKKEKAKRMYSMYEEVLGKDNTFNKTVEVILSFSIEMVVEYALLDNLELDDNQRKYLYDKLRGKYQYNSKVDYYKSPELLICFLESNYNEMLLSLNIASSFSVKNKIDDYKLNKLIEVLNKNGYEYTSETRNFYVLLAGLKSKKVTFKHFMSIFYDIKGVKITFDNMDMIMKIIKEENIEAQDELKISLLTYGYLQNIENCNLSEFEEIIKRIKKYKLSSNYLPESILLASEDVDKLFESDNLNNKEYRLKRLIEEGIVSINDLKATKIRWIDYSDQKEKLVLWSLKDNYYSLEQFLIKKKDERISNLSVNEMNVLITFLQKVIKDNGLDIDVNYFYSINPKQAGVYDFNQNSINLNKGLDCSIKVFVHTIFHEVNHAIQYRNIKEMNIEEDEDILEYGKDLVLKLILGNGYYKLNYNKISMEFDADYKALMQSALLFNEVGELFKDKENYIKDSRLDLKEDIGYFSMDYTRMQNLHLDEFFAMQFEQLKKQDELKYFKMTKFIMENTPVLNYDYDLSTGKKRDTKELIDMMYDTLDIKEKNIIKYVILNRCNEFKVGKEIASENIKLLNDRKLFSDQLAKINKNKFIKYEKTLIELIKNIRSKGVTNYGISR